MEGHAQQQREAAHGIQRVKAGQPAKGTPWQPPAAGAAPNANGTQGAATTTAPSPNGPAKEAPKPASNDKGSGTPDKH